MKRFLVFLLLAFGYLNAQPFNPVYDLKNDVKFWNNWDNLGGFYYVVLDSGEASTDSVQTSKELSISKGFDGLIQFIIQLDTLSFDANGDTFSIETGNFVDSRQVFDYTQIITRAGAYPDITSIWYTVDRYVNPVFGWVTMDTLRWLPYTNRAGTEVETFTDSHWGAKYTSRFDPQATATGEDGWMGDIPLPLRINRHALIDDTSRVFKEKLYYKEHMPNKF